MSISNFEAEAERRRALTMNNFTRDDLELIEALYENCKHRGLSIAWDSQAVALMEKIDLARVNPCRTEK